MTTAKPGGAVKGGRHFRFPDPPQRRPEDMTSFKQLTITGAAHYLAHHFGHPETTIVTGERFMAVAPTKDMKGLRFPDLLIAFNVDPELYELSNAYVISEQGKPPDFVLEIASRKTRREDVTRKRDAYAELGIPEYWRFDETARRRPKLAGDRLVEGEYQPIPIELLPDGILQGYSPALDLYLRWDLGRLQWHDPATGRHIITIEDERARADRAVEALERERARADREMEARVQAEARAAKALEARVQAEARAARVREARIQAEAELGRLGGR